MTGDYLQSFFDMVNGSIATMPYPPSEYSQFANAIVGKPLALVNVGWSLELSSPPITAQNTLGNPPGLAPDWEAKLLTSYKFPVKFGDADRPFDGVVGYWPSQNAANKVDTDFDNTFSYFVPTETDSFHSIQPANFPILQPRHIDPDPAKTPSMTDAIAANYLITTMLIDPYTPVHCYSPILPIKSLKLPPWCIQSGMRSE